MGTAVFAEIGKFRLISDDRDVGIGTAHRMEVYEWLATNCMTAELTHSGLGMDVWRVYDEAQRALFVLRWS
jgi:hypothetical protein